MSYSNSLVSFIYFVSLENRQNWSMMFVGLKYSRCFQTFRPCLSRLWTFRELGLAKFFPQTWQVYLTPWVNKCLLRHWRFLSAFPQKPHKNVLASEWDRMCSFKFDLTLKDFPQISHTCLWRINGLCSSCILIWKFEKM